MQGDTGTINVAVKIGAASETDPCATGASVGTFRITAKDGEISLDTSKLDLPLSVYTKVLTGSFTLCLEVSGDFDATITIAEMGIEFGPSEPEDEDVAPNDNAAPGDGDGDAADVDGAGDATTDDGDGGDSEEPADMDGGGEADGPADGAEGEGEGDGASAGSLTKEDLAGCWRVTFDAGEMDSDEVEVLDFIYDFDSSGDLAKIWLEVRVTTEDSSEIAIIEWVRFATPNAEAFNIISSSQNVEVDGENVHLFLEYEQDEGEEGTSMVFVKIDNAYVTGDPPDTFDAVASDVSGGKWKNDVQEEEFRGPARGQRMGSCPNPASENVITQEDWEDMDLFEECGEGAAMMMPLTLLGMQFMRRRRRVC
jgi:hypothetical protein